MDVPGTLYRHPLQRLDMERSSTSRFCQWSCYLRTLPYVFLKKMKRQGQRSGSWYCWCSYFTTAGRLLCWHKDMLWINFWLKYYSLSCHSARSVTHWPSKVKQLKDSFWKMGGRNYDKLLYFYQSKIKKTFGKFSKASSLNRDHMIQIRMSPWPVQPPSDSYRRRFFRLLAFLKIRRFSLPWLYTFIKFQRPQQADTPATINLDLPAISLKYNAISQNFWHPWIKASGHLSLSVVQTFWTF